MEVRILQNLESKVEVEIANLAEGMTDAIKRAAGGDSPQPTEQPAAGATAYAATADSGTSGEVLALLKALDTRLQKIESGRSNRRQRNRQSNDSGGGSGGSGDGGDGNGGAKCKHCKLVHPKTPEEKCWTLPENKGDAPKWFLRRLERKSKGK